MIVYEIMSKDVITANANDSAFAVAELMKEHNIGAVPVVDKDNAVLGLITDRDIVLTFAKENNKLLDLSASLIMSKEVYTISSNADIFEALDLMKNKQIRRLPVVDENKLVGMLSFGDIATNLDFSEEIGEAITEISRS